jgi:YhcH/YjgK/YiaL family protein
MIFDNIEQLRLYEPLHKGIDTVCRYLASHDLLITPHGRYELDGDKVYLSLGMNKGKGDKAKLEVHRRYIDIQCVLYGTDTIGWSPFTEYLHDVGPFDAQKDIQFFTDTPQYRFSVPSGTFAIFFPSDAHAPLGCAEETDVLKAIFKLSIECS